MTCREKLRKAHADMTDDELNNIFESYCPEEFGYAEDPEYCVGTNEYGDCTRCWDREIPEELKEETRVIYAHTNISGENNQSVADKPIIKDSGNRREFESGAVRDMQEGKGRFDLVPLEIMSDMFGDKERDHDPVLLDIATFMYDYDTCWLAAALENFADAAYNGCLPTMFLEVAKHFEEGAKKYSPDNWRKGIPITCYIDSAVRHYMKWKRGDNDEPHNRAFVWNLLCCMWEREYGEEWRKSGGSANT